ncbi:2-phospho-L-lactate transferase [Phycicoccus endophyticus]|uniref:2-phospho-L-lactate transferase n=1 Tax=Phycicoccus endophyticus TaxID=1690220 RepID=A0A7G9R341_9MICO|nr:2-phospho-L-lactate transferase [Phycicoccus endophyticus]NHI20309.1 2-phospho-L-lactate transferase [Phycicoccus endophyticus]QNN50016.1 2-phospho-L-lactate transferase [Phycicoccus endophyticus]GGL28902.1 2-phospho-L-lactate transferase [Phycicoccus endophyticus]
MRITALAGGVGGARFVRGLRHHLDATPGLGEAEVTVVANTGDDITLFGLRVSPDVDTLLYTLGGGVEEQQGWGRAEETHRVQAELAAYGALPQWFTLGDRDLGTHIIRSQWLGQGLTPSQVTARLAGRWGLPERRITLLPMTDDPVETHVVVADGEREAAIHFQEWWVRHGASLPAHRFVVAGLDRAAPAPGVLEAVRDADVVLLPPSNPVVSVGIVLGVPGVREALRETAAPVVGVSPLISGRPVRGHADACLRAIGVPESAAGVAGLYEDLLDAWLVDAADADTTLPRARVAVHDEPLLMSDVAAAGRIAAHALRLAEG